MKNINKPLQGRRIIISAGPTREYLDPVRFISNESSGRMGYALAVEAKRLGAGVVVISGPVNIPAPAGVKVVDAVSSVQMYKKIKKHMKGADIFISAAAVSDFTPLKASKSKIRKDRFNYRLELKPSVDILKKLSRKKGKCVFVGFSLEDSPRLSAYTKKKLLEKNLDFIFVNSGENLNSVDGRYLLVNARGGTERLSLMKKRGIAKKMFKFILKGACVSLLLAFFSDAGFAAQKKAAALQGASTIISSNTFVGVAVSDTGLFAIGITGGDPQKTSDDNKKLTFGYPNPGQSDTMYSIDGTAYLFGTDGVLSQVPVETDGKVVCAWTNQNIKITQELELTALSRGIEDTVKIYYKIENLDSASHTVALRIQLDTMLGENDGTPFYAAGTGEVTSDKEWTDAQLPLQVNMFDSLSDPIVASMITLRGLGFTEPDRFVIGYWPASNGKWDYTVDPDRSFLDNNGDGSIDGTSPDSDSSCIIWWGYPASKEITLAAGESVEMAVCYGLSGMVFVNWSPLEAGISAPESLEYRISGTSFIYEPSPFAVNLFFRNITGSVVSGARVAIRLPEEFSLYSGETAVKSIESVSGGGVVGPSETAEVSWLVETYGSGVGSRKFSIEMHAGGNSFHVERQIFVSGITNAVYGRITDISAGAVSGAVISIYKDGALVDTVVSGANGEFIRANLAAGKYILQIAGDGFMPLKLPATAGGDPSTAAGVYPVMRASAGLVSGIETFVYPNPVREGNARISVKTAEQMKVDVEIFTVSGQKILADELETTAFGYSEYFWDVSGVANGVYFYQVTGGGERSWGKIAVVKFKR